MEDNRTRGQTAITELSSIMNALASERDGLIQETLEQSEAILKQNLFIERLHKRIRELETMLGVGHMPIERPSIPGMIAMGASATAMANKITNLRQRASDMENALIIAAQLGFSDRDMIDREISFRRAMHLLTEASIVRATGLGALYQQGLLED